MEQLKMELLDYDFQKELFGDFDRNVKLIESQMQVHIVQREGDLVVLGSKVQIQKTKKILQQLNESFQKGNTLNNQTIRYALALSDSNSVDKLSDMGDEVILVSSAGTPIKPKTVGQKKYLDLIKKKDVTICVGPAGTGKTYLAVAMAVQAFRKEEVARIILTRPAVEAGESLGFLPGDLKDKVDPYLRPLYDGLFDIMGGEKFAKSMERGLIEVAPLAFMRGRTLDHSFIILDEAQNTTKEQMKMFLTRLGFGSKAVITGDITQVDLASNKKSGLVHASHVLGKIEEIGQQVLTDKDVVRHALVQKIILAYEKYEKNTSHRDRSERKNKR